MYLTLLRIYKTTRNEDYLKAAVAKHWITEEQKNEIMESVGN